MLNSTRAPSVRLLSPVHETLHCHCQTNGLQPPARHFHGVRASARPIRGRFGRSGAVIRPRDRRYLDSWVTNRWSLADHGHRGRQRQLRQASPSCKHQQQGREPKTGLHIPARAFSASNSHGTRHDRLAYGINLPHGVANEPTNFEHLQLWKVGEFDGGVPPHRRTDVIRQGSRRGDR